MNLYKIFQKSFSYLFSYHRILIVSYMLIDELLRFLGKIKTGNFTVSNSEITTFYSELFSLFVNSFYHR